MAKALLLNRHMENSVNYLQLSSKDRETVMGFLKKEKALVLGRYDAPTDYLSDYLARRVLEFVLVKVSIDEIGEIPLLEIINHRRGKRVFRERYRHPYFNNYFLSYVFVSFKIFKFLLRNRGFGVVIGVGPFNSWLSTFYKFVKLDSKIIYLCEDRVGKGAFDLKAKLTYWCDIWSKKQADFVWFVSLEHLKLYREKWLKKKSVFVPQPIVRPRLKLNKKKQIVFLGSISKYQGADFLYRVFKRLSTKYKDLELVIIGIGDFLPTLKKLAEKDNLSKRVEFMGFIVDRGKILNTIAESWIGVALYNPNIYKNLQYGQSAKISDYMGCGIPVVTTKKGKNTPSLSKYILNFKTGFVCDFNEKSIYLAIKKLLDERSLYNFFRKNTKKFVKIFDQDIIYPSAFARIYLQTSN